MPALRRPSRAAVAWGNVEGRRVSWVEQRAVEGHPCEGEVVQGDVEEPARGASHSRDLRRPPFGFGEGGFVCRSHLQAVPRVPRRPDRLKPYLCSWIADLGLEAI